MKKTYITPAVEVEQLGMADGILLSGSIEGELLRNGGGTADKVTESDTKGAGDWSIWE